VADRRRAPAAVDLVLDGIVGIGGTGGLRETADQLAASLRQRGRDGERATGRRGRAERAMDTGHVPLTASGRPSRSTPT
jgi:hypothetical protein